MGKGAKPPAPKAMPVAPVDPTQDAIAKQAAADAKTAEKRRSLAASAEGTFGSTAGSLGAAPTKAPSLKSTLG